MPKIQVDNREIEAPENTTVLQACLDNGIYIPNLCYLEGMEAPSASCRMCFVEVEGERQPVTSCTALVKENMVVKTDTETVRDLQRTALRLLLSVHDVDCKNCHANKNCALQNIAKFLKVGLKPKRLGRYLKEIEIDESHPFLIHYPNRCVLCGKCVHICKEKHDQPILTFAKRGFDTIISFLGVEDSFMLDCSACHACIDICPVGALALGNNQHR
ncbi:MAG: 2Fe-2S iron-sulfur cluster-binding protein [Desulfobacterales bacterium]